MIRLTIRGGTALRVEESIGAPGDKKEVKFRSHGEVYANQRGGGQKSPMVNTITQVSKWTGKKCVLQVSSRHVVYFVSSYRVFSTKDQ